MVNKQMDYLLLFKKPISDSVLEYATDNFTKSNAVKLVELSEERHKSELIYVVKELIKWYKSNIEAIKQDRFIFRKEDHYKSYDMLQLIENQLTTDM